MSLTEIESELQKLTAEELRHLALKSWQVFLAKEGLVEARHQSDERDADLLGALDEAIEGANRTPGEGRTAKEVRSLLNQWTSK